MSSPTRSEAPAAAEDAARRVAAGDLAGALASLQQQVRRQPADARLRIFLFQLLVLLRQWPRAAQQLVLCGELDAGALAMVATCREALQAEQVREAVMSGRTTPLVFGEPPAWIGLLAEALAADGRGDAAVAAVLRARALEQAPACSGTLDGRPFTWLADADSRLGPVLEVMMRGRYGWLPLQALRRIEIDAPEDLRDLVWLPARLTFVSGGETVALLPVRYAPDADADSEGEGEGGDPAALRDARRLARRTDWIALAPQHQSDQFRGLGQRLLCTEAEERGLLEVREIVIDAPAGEREGEGERGDEGRGDASR
ncbi:type VI secretion system protein ImpE [Sphaerotilus sulfidivorans]|uniref:Type VI secretion system protein ImpE n=1 Tax=Sphaerotilus sulfidivorans TaxID=639200 RepID=A0A5C1PW80_9BURK|nr:type VI secretion system accessory protein TagJ [Sphaerotilus sulfidivorans]NZD47906.1 virulence protein SciE type [Sphaerotilus sulfidivorans]QEN00023.1 virulence protein SciE type [Sphaerotilus sulfidivorans]